MNEKIQSQHLKRSAYVYVRQSTMHQVRHHQESNRRQYELAERARRLGFAKTIVIDEDQGKSGSGSSDRPGFAQLLTAVCQGEAGAVLALEASRLARNNRDWHHLIDLCALAETLIIDGEGVYDPRQLNDRLLLGLKGTMSEFELGLFRQRAREAFEQKVRRGHAMWELPVGFVRNEDDRIEKIPDRQIQEAIEGVFRKFRELGSARQTTLWYRDQQIPLPHVQPGTAGKKNVWRLPSGHRIEQMIKNPCYAGAFVYGRTKGQTVVKNGRARRATTRQRKPRSDWSVLILDNHSGYTSWEQYLGNQKLLESNSAMREGTGTGAVKSGPALLGGLLRCARCGRKLHVAYGGTGGRVPRYACHGGRTNRGSASCLSVGGLRIDRAVCEEVLSAIQPAGIQASLKAMEQVLEQDVEKRRSLELALEKARYEARRAERQHDTVDPENRLVAGELEARWNQALVRVRQLEDQVEHFAQQRTSLSDEQKERLLQLGQDLPSAWNQPAASDEIKKRILRTVLREIIVNNCGDPPEHHLVLHWQGTVHTELRFPWNRSGQHRKTTDRSALDLIRELSKVLSDQAIAATLNRLGYRTGAGNTWRVHSVQSARSYHRLPNHRNGEEWLTIERAARELGVSHTVVRRLIREKQLPALQVVETAPWIIHRPDLALPDVQADVARVRQGRQLPRTDSRQQQIPFK